MMNRKKILKQFLLEKEPYKLLQLLEVVKLLLVKYGKKLSLPSFSIALQKINPEVAMLIQLFEKAKMLKVAQISSFIRDFQAEMSESELHFSLESNDEEIHEPLLAYLEKKFGEVQLEFKSVDSENLSVQVKGQGYVFKRSLERDLDLLLA